MERIEEKSLYIALKEANMLRMGLPKLYDKNSGEIWIKAIVLVTKNNLESCYCIYQRHGDGYMSLLQDCGSGTGIIKSILRIYPYIYLDKERFYPNVGYKQKRSFLKTELSYDYTLVEAVDSMTDEEVDIALINEGIRRQLASLEIDRLNNKQIEGSDLDETRTDDILDKEFEAEVSEMRAAGISQIEIKAFMDKHDADKKALNQENFESDDNFMSEADELRQEMEAKDMEEHKKNDVSIDGEFAPKEIDIEAIKAESERYRHEQRLISKRKFKRRIDGQGKFTNGSSCINELGEIEAVETISLPDDASQTQKDILNGVRKKVGRPKGSKSKK